jgi:hypothetical protein
VGRPLRGLPMHRVLATDPLARGRDDWRIAPSVDDVPPRVWDQLAVADFTHDTTLGSRRTGETHEPRCDLRGNRLRPEIRSATEPDVRSCSGYLTGALHLWGSPRSSLAAGASSNVSIRSEPSTAGRAPARVRAFRSEDLCAQARNRGVRSCLLAPCSKVQPARGPDRTRRTVRPRATSLGPNGLQLDDPLTKRGWPPLIEVSGYGWGTNETRIGEADFRALLPSRIRCRAPRFRRHTTRCSLGLPPLQGFHPRCRGAIFMVPTLTSSVTSLARRPSPSLPHRASVNEVGLTLSSLPPLLRFPTLSHLPP